ncbi:hypothetical protein, partial [Staphylococcus pseudintermedius]|uniref:hypothetical protein n=1 Tax=Staphylococcus pseudintermedius TaxID=283734 RepID=UPI003F689E58
MRDAEVGEIDDESAAKLYNGAPEDYVDSPVQFNVRMVDKDREMTASEQEAYFIAQQVHTILENQKVDDPKTG